MTAMHFFLSLKKKVCLIRGDFWGRFVVYVPQNEQILISHLQLISGSWFPGCGVWWGRVALDHQSIQRPCLSDFKTKAPQFLPAYLPPQLFSSSPLLLPTGHKTESGFSDGCESITMTRLISYSRGTTVTGRVSLVPSGPERMPTGGGGGGH